MALLDFLKKTEKGTPARQSTVRHPDKGPRKEPKKSEEKEVLPKVVLKESKIAWRVLREPHITEKATSLTRLNQYIFRIQENASKDDVRHAIQEIYGVHVVKVRKIHIPKKKRRHGRHIGWKSGYTKAIVELRKGEKIEVLPH